jgi:phage terminase large subunit-like protein
VRYWTPTPDKNIDIDEIKQFIIDLKMAGFRIALVTFDQWNSAAYRQQLKSDFKINTDLLSVAKPHYEDFSLAIGEQRIKGYALPLLVDELLGLRVIKGNKVDHQRKGTKDVSDAVVGAVYNVIKNEKKLDEIEIDIFVGELDDEYGKPEEVYIEPPKQEPAKKMPKQLASFIGSRKKEDEIPEEVNYNPDPEMDLSIFLDGKKEV